MFLLRACAIFIEVDRFAVAPLPVVGKSPSDQVVDKIGNASHSEISSETPERSEAGKLVAKNTKIRDEIIHVALDGIAVFPIELLGNIQFRVEGALKETIGRRTHWMIDCPA